VTKSALKPLVLSAAVASALAVLAAPAYALEAKISGQVNRAIMHADDGVDSEIFHVDPDNSSTRFRFTGSEDIGPGLKAGIVWEVEDQSNDSDKVTLSPVVKSVKGTTFGERKMEVYFAGAFGQVTVGQGDGAMNGGIEVDLSGTTVISYSGTADLGGAIGWRPTGGGAAVSSLRGSINQQDFESRYDRLRYDSPKLGPITIAVSTGSNGSGNDAQEYGIWYSQNLGAGGKIAGALGFSTSDTATAAPNVAGDKETTGGSISWLHPSGWNVTFATSQVEDDDPAGRKKKFNYVKGGYMMGKHAFSVDFARGEEQAAADEEAEHFGFQYVFVPTKAVDLYAGFKTVSLDRPGADFEDIQIITVGSRVKF
jgi:predicted porin